MSDRKRILIADDEFNTRAALERFFKRKYHISTAADGEEALRLIETGSFDLVLTDLRMPGADGMSVLKAASQKGIACILLTAYGSITDAVQAVKLGAYDFVSKPVKLNQLETVMETALEKAADAPSPAPQKTSQKREDSLPGVVLPDSGNSPMTAVCETARTVAPSRASVLLTGESGTGKELMAQSIHNFSARKDKPFVAINCAALPESLLESELFGYEQGAFTGASPHGKIGLFEQANHGTIFLDEIGDMSLNLQARLLRVLQEKQVTRLGSDRVTNLDIRVLAATNRDLASAVQNREFREDLYYRLCNIPIKLPALRERNGDILYIFRSFVEEKYERLTAEEIQMMKTYTWPGNIRELKNAADYFLILGELPQTLLSYFQETVPAPSSVKSDSPSDEKQDVEFLVLSIIAQHTSDSSGIGRVPILHELSRHGIHISDDKLRKLLKQLESQGRITVGRGRTGCRITS